MEEIAPGQSIYYSPPQDKMLILEPATLEVDAPEAIKQAAAKLDEKISQASENVKEVVREMKTTVDLVMERGESIQELESRASVLEEGAAAFEKQATKLFDEHWKENLKGIALLAALVLIFFLIFFSKSSHIRMF